MSNGDTSKPKSVRRTENIREKIANMIDTATTVRNHLGEINSISNKTEEEKGIIQAKDDDALGIIQIQLTHLHDILIECRNCV